MNPKRSVGLADLAERAGTMESSKGRATAVPTPRKNVRLAKAFLVINMIGYLRVWHVIELFAPPAFERVGSSQRPGSKKKKSSCSTSLPAASPARKVHHNIANCGPGRT